MELNYLSPYLLCAILNQLIWYVMEGGREGRKEGRICVMIKHMHTHQFSFVPVYKWLLSKAYGYLSSREQFTSWTFSLTTT